MRPYQYEMEEDEEIFELPLGEAVSMMTEEEKAEVKKHTVEMYRQVKKWGARISYEECSWQAFAEFILAKYGLTEEETLQ